MLNTDILIVGSGVAGLMFAIKTAQKRRDLSITILTKDGADATNTRYAQGGVAAVMNRLEDSFEQHIQDTIQSGGGLCDENIVKMVVQQAPERLRELINLGVSFDTNQQGNWDLGLEGGHSQSRILHHKDLTGLEIERVLLHQAKKQPNIILFEHHSIIDLLIENNNKKRCIGVVYFDKKHQKIGQVHSRITMLCSGGCGQLFQHTTNPAIATGDGVAIAHRAGALIEQMHYIQFHPTALFQSNTNPYFLISEAVRGFGATVVNHEAQRFLFQYDLRGELATRDIVSKAIGTELQKSGKEYAFLDCRHIESIEFEKHFPTISSYCQSIGIYPNKDLIPIVPVAHYQCGGITVNEKSRTSINNLYAAGECTKTGLHGKNRLASNSLLEALVFAHQGAEDVCNSVDLIDFAVSSNTNNRSVSPLKINTMTFPELKRELQTAMNYFYLNQSENHDITYQKIEDLKAIIHNLANKDSFCLQLQELENMLTVASIIVEHSTISYKKISIF